MRRNRGLANVELPEVGQRKRKAFTLVELLVVIGIIALLISILLPAMASARRQAMKTKCAAQMRDLGNAMLMYSQDNKGYLPTIRLNNIVYTIDSLTYHKGATEVYGSIINENAKWWHFVAKYVTKKKSMPQTGPEMNAFMQSVFWCPAWEGYTDNTGAPVNMIGGINRNLPGIGMNWYPSFTPSHPQAGTDFPTDSLGRSEIFGDSLTNSQGKQNWYRLSQYTQPSQRALLADARQFYLEAKSVPSSAAIPGQRLNYANADYSSGVSGQTMYDFYRHGVYPPVQNTDPTNGYYATKGGKIGYNILFADNHVESPSDRETGYRACRMRFPN